MSDEIVDCGGVYFSPLRQDQWTTWSCPAVYAFVHRDWYGARQYLYFGECESIRDRIGPDHEKWSGALALGMNEILVHLSAETKAQRLAVEARLRNSIPTPLNKQNALMQFAGLLGAFGSEPVPQNYLAPFSFAPPQNAMARKSGEPVRSALAELLAAEPPPGAFSFGSLAGPYRNALLPGPDDTPPVNSLLTALLKR